MHHNKSYAIGAVALLLCFFLSALLFCTSMLSTSTVMPNTGKERCEAVKPVDQVVLILVDAMRPDFVLSALRRYSRDDGGCTPQHSHDANDDPNHVPDYYTGPTLRYMQDAMNDVSDASHGFFLVADSPTTTAQRIKAIGTGTMPAFLEAGSNFNSEATPIDSIVRQTRGRAVLLGDDTWAKLFPGKEHWKRSVAIPSFDVADFDTNDDAVLGTIVDVLVSETAENGAESYAKLIVAHFLGIDHVGHRINAANRAMDRKITQLNTMLHNVSRTLRQRRTNMNTMLLVLGDHGMTQNGDHGGATALETDTFLFAQLFRGSEQFPESHRRGNDLSAMTTISQRKAALKRKLAAARQEEQADQELVRLDSCRAVSGVDASQIGAAYQVDITPTVSVLLGNPIPYSSFGRLLPEVLALADEEADLEKAERCNERQMARYFRESGMDIPVDPPWEHTKGNTTRERIAAMSFYARRTRTDMNMGGMVLGGLAWIACALSAFAFTDVRVVFRAPSATIVVGCCVLVIRWGITLANSFIVHEDVAVFGLFVFYLLVAFVAKRAGTRLTKWAASGGREPPSRAKAVAHCLLHDHVNCGILAATIVARCLLPYTLKHRFHITHAVESASVLDEVVRSCVWGSLGPLLKRAGLFAGAFLWVLTAPQDGGRTRRPSLAPVAALTVGAMSLSHGISVVHHLVPILLVVSFHLLRKPTSLCTTREYAYFVWTLWHASICNELVVSSVLIATYAVLLPVFIAALEEDRVYPPVQAVLLHLLSFATFFMMGHQCLLSTIDWNASFVGLPGYNMFLGGFLVLSRTFNAFLLVPVACKLVAVRRSVRLCTKGHANETVRPSGSFGFLRYLLLVFMVVEAAMSAFSTFIQRNHLMLFPIFCPKLLFDVVSCLMTGAGILFSFI